jgi:hypothetical protein
VSEVATVVAILSSAVVVLGGLVAVTRALWKVAQDIRDNKLATEENTVALADLTTKMDGRITALEAWRVRQESRRWRR